MSKHTPGPWEAWNVHGKVTMRNWRIGERNTTPGVVRPIATIANEELQRSGEEQIANAALIASAPDLLEVCEAFVALWPVVGDRDTPKATPEVIAFWRAARAAIAKAKGGAQ